MNNPESWNQVVLKAFLELKQKKILSSGDDFSNYVFNFIAKKLNSLGFEEVDGTAASNKSYIKLLLTNSLYSSNLAVISQPFGSQQFPDLIIKHQETTLMVETKSSKTSKIIWNGGLPKEGGIYIYNNCVKNKLTYFLGEDVLSAEERRILLKTHQDLSQSVSITKANNDKLEQLGSNFKYYARAMYNDSTNYDTDPKRTQWQLAVEDYIGTLNSSSIEIDSEPELISSDDQSDS